MGQNLIEKIAQAHAVGLGEGESVHQGDFLTVRPHHVMTHDNTAAVMKKFALLGAQEMADAGQPIFTLDHKVQDISEENLSKYQSIKDFAALHGVRFHPAGRGIGHQIMIEEGYAWPGKLVVASDSHSNVYGGIGALGTPVVRTDAAALWATGTTWWQLPPVTRVVLAGKLRPGVSGKDVIITLCGLYAEDEVLNHALEFTGAGVATLTIEERLTIANMTTEWGALTGVFPIDQTCLAWLGSNRDRASAFTEEAYAALVAAPPTADADAYYTQTIHLDLEQVSAFVCGPDTVKLMHAADEMATRKVKIDKAYLLSCVNGRVQDLAEAADILRGHQVADGVGLYLAAASDRIQQESERRGDWQTLLDAGAHPLPAGCGPCIGMGAGLLEDGEVGISATNRNFKGRMGSREAEAYLASPAVVAASALHGYITPPQATGTRKPTYELEQAEAPARGGSAIRILEGFPQEIVGEILWCDADNLNTDGIYPGKYTYREDMSAEEMAAVAMENYDPAFQELAEQGDLLVSGFNFGTGSSREQAATALRDRGLRLVVAGSFSATYKRNAFNNGYLLVESPRLIAALREAMPASAPTHRSGMSLKLDFGASQATVDELGSFPISPLGPTAQELILAGGLEALVRQRLEQNS